MAIISNPTIIRIKDSHEHKTVIVTELLLEALAEYEWASELNVGDTIYITQEV